MIDTDDCENGELATDSQILLGWRLTIFLRINPSPKTENIEASNAIETPKMHRVITRRL